MKPRYLFTIFLFLLFFVKGLNAQTDKEFWFAAPYVTPDHNPPGGQPLFFFFTTLDVAATITLEMPNNPSFPTQVFNVPANSTFKYDIPTALNGEVMNMYDTKDGIPGKSNKAIHITSTSYITVYYEYSNFNNPDIWALKGRNALGTEFFTSFQNVMDNVNKNNNSSSGGNCQCWTQPAYSAFDVAFTEDNTFLTFEIPAGLSIYNGAGAPLSGTVTIGPFNRGDSYSGIPAINNAPEGGGIKTNDIFGRSMLDHLAGVRITTNGGKKIAVSLKDDSMKSLVGGCYDLVGDQTVPTDIIGTEYIAMRGELTTGNLKGGWYSAPPPNPVIQESLFILATEDNTDIYINGAYWTTLDKAETGHYTIPDTDDFTHIESVDSAVYVFQITGPSNGCEMGAAVLPSISKCTGSTKVGFTRSYDADDGEDYKFYMNIMVRKGAEDAFLLNGNPVPFIGLGDFHDVPGSAVWRAARIGPIDKSLIKARDPMLLVNTEDVFHLGTINGDADGGARFGYFSDYNSLLVEAFISNTGSGDIRMCYGETVQLVAKGGTECTWKPAAYLDDPYSFNPMASPKSTTQYVAVIEGACDLKDSTAILIQVAPPIIANFTLDTTFGCSPLTVGFSDKSKGVKEFHWDFGDGTNELWTSEDTIDIDTSWTRQYTNVTTPEKEFTVELIAINSNLCRDTLERFITVYPQVTANMSADVTEGCNPLMVNYTNTSTNASDYFWEFGDGGSSNNTVPSHQFSNMGDDDTTYTTQFVASSISQGFNCSDTLTTDILVHPFINVSFTVDTVEKCSPLRIKIVNNSQGVDSFFWDLGDTTFITTSKADIFRTYENTSTSPDTITISLTGRNEGGSTCEQVQTRQLIVYPEVNAVIANSNTVICDSTEISFGNNSTGYNLQYEWSFGDGGSTNEEDPEHLFYNRLINADKVYNVMLKATSVGNRYCYDTDTITVTVHPYVKADFSFDYATACTPFPVTLNNSSFQGFEYQWDYDDDGTVDTTTYNKQAFVHTFVNTDPNNSRTYNVNLRAVSNHSGCFSEKSRSLTVFPEVIADFTTDVNVGCNPLDVNFSNNSTGGSLTFSWNFDDSTSSSSSAPTLVHSFKNFSDFDRVYNVTLKATNSNGCEDTYTTPIEVYARVDADFSIDVAEGCSPLQVTIDNATQGGISQYFWDFDDGTPISNLQEPTHTYINQTSSDQTRNLRLVVKNNHDCYDTITRPIDVYPEVRAAFITDVIQGCNPLQVNFSNQSNTPVAKDFLWDFDDGSSTTLINPTHSFENLTSTLKTFSVNLAVESEHGCVDDTTLDVSVFPFVDALFQLKSADGCSPFDIEISNNTPAGATQYTWDFDDGSAVSTLKEPLHTFVNQTNDNITRDLKLVVRNTQGCSDSLVKAVTVYPELFPDFISNVTSGCNPLQVAFTNTSKTMNIPVEYRWEFGDNSSADTKHAQHVFNNTTSIDKTFDVKLTATSESQCVADTSYPIEVFAFIEADFSLADPAGCSPFSPVFTNASPAGANRFFWDFGDGSPIDSSRIPNHTFINQSNDSLPLTRTIELRVKNNHECYDSITRTIDVYPEVTSNFSMIPGGCTPLQVDFTNSSTISNQYFWKFGDNATSHEKNPSHTYYNHQTTDKTLTVELISTSAYGCKDSIERNINVYHRPKAAFEVAEFIDCPPFNVEITNTSLTSQSTYHWNFGDGSEDTTTVKNTIYHEYHNPDSSIAPFTISMVATTDHNCTDNTSQTINVYPQVYAGFESDTTHCNPFDLDFTNTTRNANNFIWDFDDGTLSNQAHPTHVFFNNGIVDRIFNVKMNAESKYGCKDSAFTRVTVYPSPDADFSVAPTLQYYPSATFSIFNNSEPSNGYWDYKWDYGDGTVVTDKNPSDYTYSHWGEYEISLSVTSANCHDSISQKVMLIPPVPVAAFDSSFKGCAPVEMNFRNQSSWGEYYQWDFDDGTTSTTEHPTHVYEEEGIYNVKLVVEGEGGISHAYQQIEVYPNPVASFEVKPTSVLLPDASVQCYSTSEKAKSYLWDFGDGTTSTEPDPKHTYEELGQYHIRLKVWTDQQCVDSFMYPDPILVAGEGILEFPNAFSPSLTGPADQNYDPTHMNNDIFFPEHKGVKDYHLEIYTRWGELVFVTDDINVGWNGYYKGKLAKQDVYVWKASGMFWSGKPYEKAGDVTLIHNPHNPN